MTQSNFRIVLGFTLFGMLAGPFVTSAGLVMWLVSTVTGLVLGSVFYLLSVFVLSQPVAILSRFGFWLVGLLGGAGIGALIGQAWRAMQITLDVPIGLPSVLACATLTLIAWTIIRLTFGQAGSPTSFQPRASFALAMLFTWIIGLLGSLFYPLFAGLLNAAGFGALTGGVTGAFLGSALGAELERRTSKRARRR